MECGGSRETIIREIVTEGTIAIVVSERQHHEDIDNEHNADPFKEHHMPSISD